MSVHSVAALLTTTTVLAGHAPETFQRRTTEMAMTKKDFELVADVINAALWTPKTDPVTISLIIGKMADRFSLAYERFQRDRFIQYATRNVTLQEGGDNDAVA